MALDSIQTPAGVDAAKAKDFCYRTSKWPFFNQPKFVYSVTETVQKHWAAEEVSSIWLVNKNY